MIWELGQRGAVMGRIIKEVVWPQGIFSKLGRVVGALSALALIQYGFEFGFAATVRVLMAYYDNLVSALLGWTQPYVVRLLVWVNAYFDWNLQLFPHWKHIFVLLSIYFFRSAAVNYSYGYPATATFGLIWGVIVALASSVAAGVVPFIGADKLSSLMVASIPIAGIFVFDLLKQVWNATFIRTRAAMIYQREKWTWWEFFRPNLYLVICQTLASFVLVWAVVQIPWVQGLSSPSLIALGLLIVALACYRIGIGAYEVKELRKEEGGRNLAPRLLEDKQRRNRCSHVRSVFLGWGFSFDQCWAEVLRPLNKIAAPVQRLPILSLSLRLERILKGDAQQG